MSDDLPSTLPPPPAAPERAGRSRVLVVDDQPVVRELLLELLRSEDREVIGAPTAKEALRLAKSRGPIHVALVDRDLPDGSGVVLARQLLTTIPNLEVILTSVSPSVQAAIEAVEVGVHDYLSKPFEDIAQVEVRVRRAEHQSRLSRERQELHEELRKSEERYRKLFSASPDAIVVYEAATGIIREVNEAATRLYRSPTSELIGQNVAALRHTTSKQKPSEDEAPDSRASVRPEGIIARVDRRADGTELAVEVSEGTFGELRLGLTIEVIRDIRERVRAEQKRRELEAQLRQAQKMEALGLLAGGIAHDFNNLLAVIINYSSFVRDQLSKRGDALSLSREVDDVEQILQAANSAASVTRQLLAFSRREVHSPEVVDINAVIRAIEKLVRHTLGEHVDLITELGTNLPMVRVDRAQFEQVVINLAVNARDALSDTGRVILRTEFIEPSAEIGGAGAVVLSVIDNGVGIDPQNLERIFDPFFTTKGPGSGTGLGLSTVKGIVEQAGGSISVSSEPGAQTTFMVSLPPTLESAAQHVPTQATSRSTGGEKILLVDDDAAVRRAAARILDGAGYKVIEAQSGAEALALHEREDSHVDLLLSDVMMPRMSGDELADMLIARQPDLRVIFLTGFASQGLAERASRSDRMDLQLKPFDNDSLLSLVRQVLDRSLPPRFPSMLPPKSRNTKPPGGRTE